MSSAHRKAAPRTRALALHQITAMEVAPVDLPALAKAVGCAQICVFVRSPLVPVAGTDILGSLFPFVAPDDVPVMQDALAESGVTVLNVEYFPIEAETDIEGYRSAIETGAALGAARLVTHVHDVDEARAIRKLRELCDLAAEKGMLVGLEFMGLSPGCNSLEMARHIVATAERTNLGIAVDALHLVRTGGTPAQVAAMDPAEIAYVQMCDGAHCDPSDDYLPEALNRMVPGKGVFPLKDLLEALPPTVAIDVEVPSPDLAASGRSALERAREAVSASRRLIEAYAP